MYSIQRPSYALHRMMDDDVARTSYCQIGTSRQENVACQTAMMNIARDVFLSGRPGKFHPTLICGVCRHKNHSNRGCNCRGPPVHVRDGAGRDYDTAAIAGPGSKLCDNLLRRIDHGERWRGIACRADSAAGL
jgi:hypothetical protein